LALRGRCDGSALTQGRDRMGDLVLTTFDWVPEAPRGFVRDLRVR
jgi:hypothetical protein